MSARRAQAAAVAAVVVLAALVWALLGRRLEVPTVFGDELIYWDAGRSLAQGHGLHVRDGAYGFGPVYPALLALAHLVAGSDLEAYRLARVVGAVVFALAAVPVFLLARRVLPPRWALACAALAVAIPSGLYTGMVMTEGVAYAAACLAFLACAVVLERPTVGNQLLALAAIGLAAGIRAQLAALGVALVLALALRWLLARGARLPARTDLVRLWPLLAAVGLAAVGLGARALSGDLLGGYEALLRSYDPVETARWTVRALGGLGLYLGLVPLVVAPDAALVLARESRAGSRASAALLTLAASVSACLLLVVGAFSSTEFGVGFLHDRYLFYAAPLWVVGLAVWAERGRPVSRVALAAGALLAVVTVVPLAGTLLNKDGGRQFDAIGSALPAEVAVRLGRNDPSTLMLVGAVAVAVLLPLLVPARLRWPLLALVGCVFAANTALVSDARTASARNATFVALTPRATSWVDREVPSDARVVLLAGPVDVTARDALRLTEFFNARVGRVTALDEELAPTVRTDEVRIGAGGVVLGADGKPLRADWVLTPGNTTLDGTLVATGTRAGLRLWRTGGVVRVSAVG